MPNRRILIERSTDLETWDLWSAPDNVTRYFNEETLRNITADRQADDEVEYFRARVYPR